MYFDVYICEPTFKDD